MGTKVQLDDQATSTMDLEELSDRPEEKYRRIKTPIRLTIKQRLVLLIRGRVFLSYERQNLYEWYITDLTRFLLGFPLYHTIGVGVVYLRKKPYLLGSLTMILTQLIQILGHCARPFSKSYYNFVKKFAYWEIRSRM